MSCTTPLMIPASRAALASATAPSSESATGFSVYTCLPAAIALPRLATRALVTSVSKYTSTPGSDSTSSTLVDQRGRPCRSAISRSRSSLRPTSTGSG